MRSCVRASLLAVIGLAVLAGCAPKEFTIETMREMCPPRPTELDMLDVLVGTWDMTGQMKPADDKSKPLTMKGTMKWEWDMDKRLLVGRFEGKVENEIVMNALEIWTWDPSKEKFMMYWQGGYGHIGKGHAKWDSAKREFRMTAKGRDLNSGMEFSGKGHMRFTDDRTIEMIWNDYDSLGLFKMFEHSGVAKKR